MTRSSESRAEWLRDFTLGLREEFNLSEHDALNRASNLMDRIGAMRPADKYYWPGADKEKRNQEILRSLNRMTLPEVCKKYNISQRRVYSIRSTAMKNRHEQTMLERNTIK